MAEISWGRGSRREFLGVAGTAAGLAALPAWFAESQWTQAWAEEKSPNERPRVALIGCGGMGTGDGKNAQRFGDVVAVCDVDATHVDAALTTFKGARGFADYRKV